VYAPVTGGSRWPRDVMVHAGASFDAMDVHNYDADITSYTERMRGSSMSRTTMSSSTIPR
jgi:hypothetical protein